CSSLSAVVAHRGSRIRGSAGTTSNEGVGNFQPSVLISGCSLPSVRHHGMSLSKRASRTVGGGRSKRGSVAVLTVRSGKADVLRSNARSMETSGAVKRSDPTHPGVEDSPGALMWRPSGAESQLELQPRRGVALEPTVRLCEPWVPLTPSAPRSEITRRFQLRELWGLLSERETSSGIPSPTIRHPQLAGFANRFADAA